MDYPHNTQIIYQSIIDIFHEYNLKRDLGNKIFSISFDNANNNIKSINLFYTYNKSNYDGRILH
jgi:hypothetical protein